MESGRVIQGVAFKKPKVIFTKNVSFFKDLNVGDKGELGVELEISGIELIPDESMNEFKQFQLDVKKPSLIKEKRLTV